MSQAADQPLGVVVSLWRYPVKSMMGEELNATEVGDRGLLGDRAYAVLDRSDGKVASAKNPRKWPRMFEFRAGFTDPPHLGAPAAPVRITLPDGGAVTSDQAEVNQSLSWALSREVTLQAAERGQEPAVESTFPNPWSPRAEEYWPDLEELASPPRLPPPRHQPCPRHPNRRTHAQPRRHWLNREADNPASSQPRTVTRQP